MSEFADVDGQHSSAASRSPNAPIALSASPWTARFKPLAEKFVSAALIAAIFGLIALSFRYGIDRDLEGKLTITGRGQFVYAVCGIISQAKYKTGRYVCAGSAQQQMRDVGLHYEDETLNRIGKTTEQWLADTAFLNEALGKLFALEPLPTDGGVFGFGWGGDAGYMDYVQFAFRLFGHRIQALYYSYFLLLATSAVLFCAQFWRNFFALFAVAALEYSIFKYLDVLQGVRIDSVSNPRFISTLVFIPLFHALFLKLGRARIDLRALALLAPQAILVALAIDTRSLAYSSVLALTLCCLLLLLLDLRRKSPLLHAAARYWPAYAIFFCLAMSAALQAQTTDSRLASIGGMRYHTFWEPLYYDLQMSPQ
jgi:hypothetical protein